MDSGPRWLILNRCIDDEGGDTSVADAKTTAASCTSSGKPFSISFGIAAPPACCSLHFHWLDGSTPGDSDGKQSKSEPGDVHVIAGHDDALLIQMRMRRVLNPNVQSGQPATTTTFDDYFLYEAGGGAARPPSLSLLPGFYIPVQSGYRSHCDPTPRFRYLSMENTGILRRGKDDDDDDLVLCMLRIGRDREWIVKRVPIVEHCREGSSELLQQPWHWWLSFIAHAAVPVGNRFLCWVDYNSGFIVCDMADEETPKLRYVPLPATKLRYRRCRCTLGAAGADAVRFVSVTPPPCSSFNVTIWTLTLSTEEATTWVKDVVLDCDEIWKWRLPNYGRLPHDKHLEYPLVSSDDPDVICFRMEGMAVQINTRSKKLLSVIPSGSRDQHKLRDISIAAKLRW
ncbi:hypothetical protein BDA96_05G059300 [Sorghum bicolor]|uniref:DUF1618 domain-containing protein n=1 Tax=Sorghum bicolor TaxID=4558 RepID=A0A921UEH4_SORBI|nr:hypothetical protein BDA96_05G059300 [Sorghum bicolor]